MQEANIVLLTPEVMSCLYPYFSFWGVADLCRGIIGGGINLFRINSNRSIYIARAHFIHLKKKAIAEDYEQVVSRTLHVDFGCSVELSFMRNVATVCLKVSPVDVPPVRRLQAGHLPRARPDTSSSSLPLAPLQ